MSFNGEGIREALDAGGIGLLSCVRLIRVGLGFRTNDVGEFGERKQIAHFGRIEHVPHADSSCGVLVEIPDQRGAELIPVLFKGDNLRAEHEPDRLAHEHLLQHRDTDFRLEAEIGNVALARVRLAIRAGANAVAECIIRARSAGDFDESILIQSGDPTRGCLSADPICFVGETDRVTVSRHSQGRADAPHSGTRNQDIAGDLRDVGRNSDPDDGAGRIARDGDVLHVDQSVFSR